MYVGRACSDRLEDGDDSVDMTDVKAMLAVIGNQKKQIKELEDKAALTVQYSNVTLEESMTVNPWEVRICTLVTGCAFVWHPAGWLNTAQKTEAAEAQVALEARKP
jgi:hypothetical protein